MLPRRLEKYEILEEVGQGGMAKVFRSHDTALGREVAIKVLHAHLAADPEARRRLEREAQAVAQLQHDNILQIFDYSASGPESYIVTEYIHGVTLTSFLERHGVPLPELGAMIVAELCTALLHAHAHGIIHRDIKPDNVMIRDDGRLKLMDFGLAQVIDKERMTMTGQLLGSPAYMAPEHVEGKKIDFRTDVFSAGVLLYQLGTGELPFQGKNPHEVLKRIAEGKYIDARLRNAAVGDRLGRIIARALARAPEARYPSVQAMLDDLHGYLAEANIGEPREVLARFFAAPEPFVRELRPRLAATLYERAEEAARARRRAAALELVSRVLTLEPTHTGAKELLARLERGRRIGQGAALLALLGAGATVILVLPSLAPRASPTLAPAPAVPVVTARPIAPPPEEKAEEAPPPPAARPRPEPPRPAAPAKMRRVAIQTFPKAVSVSLDGKPVPYDDSRPYLEVPAAGRHVLHFENPACYPVDKEITSDRVSVHLAWKPARIRIESNAPGAIFLRGDRLVPGGHLELPVEGDGREIAVEIHASAPGYVPRVIRCAGLAGEERVCKAVLEEETE